MSGIIIKEEYQFLKVIQIAVSLFSLYAPYSSRLGLTF